MRPLKAAEMQEANLTSMVLFMKRIDIAGLGHCDFMSRPGSLARAGRGGRHWAPDLALRAGTGCGLSGRTFLIRDRRSPKCKNVGSSCSDCRGHWPWGARALAVRRDSECGRGCRLGSTGSRRPAWRTSLPRESCCPRGSPQKVTPLELSWSLGICIP